MDALHFNQIDNMAIKRYLLSSISESAIAFFSLVPGVKNSPDRQKESVEVHQNSFSLVSILSLFLALTLPVPSHGWVRFPVQTDRLVLSTVNLHMLQLRARGCPQKSSGRIPPKVWRV